MEFLVPKSVPVTWQERVATMAGLQPLAPFADLTLDFVDSVSKWLLADRSTRAWPELLAVAHWMRKGHLLELRKSFAEDQRIRLARGLVVHFAPSNVDTIFLYSWFLSLLAGNANFVRVSRRRGPQLSHLLTVLEEVLAQPPFAVLRERNTVVSYDHDRATTTEICSRCAVRVLWGGDHTVNSLRQIPLSPLATELAFADRFSVAVFRAQAVSETSEEELLSFVRRFYNDTFSFDQLACSSPRLIAWTGTKDEITNAKQKFWTRFEQHVAEKQVSYPSVVGINRMTAAYAYAATGQAEAVTSATCAMPTRIQLRDSAQGFRELHCGGGLFLEKDLHALPDLAETLTAKDQTLSYFGYEPEDFTTLTQKLPARSLDRIVPVGRALEFSSTWDGVDLLHAFTRRVEIW
jgi:hypothetical protein